MRIHRNAKTTPATRQLLSQRVLHGGWTLSEASAAMGVSRQTGHKWVFAVSGLAIAAEVRRCGGLRAGT